MRVSLKANGDLAFQRIASGPERLMKERDLLAEVGEIVARNPDQPVIIAAAKNLRYEKVMSMLDELRRAGASKIGLETRVDSGP